MLRFPKALLAAAVLLAGAVAGTQWAHHAPDVHAQEAVGVSMIGNRFVPETIVVPAGTIVVWTNEDYDSGEWHDVISEDGSIFADVFGPGQSYAFTFITPGVYNYYCDLHAGMFVTVIMEEQLFSPPRTP